MSKRRRIEKLNAEFVEGHARGWSFGVSEAFRACLDIRLDMRVDKAANQALAERLGRKLSATERIVRPIWTQGSPAAYSFSRGHLLHEPAEVATLPWAEALPKLRRSVLVLDAKPDDEALSNGTATDERPETADTRNATAADVPAAMATDAATGAARQSTLDFDVAPSDEADTGGRTDSCADAEPAPTDSAAGHSGGGWVEFEVYHYEGGVITQKENRRLSQAAFVHLLQSGQGL